MNIITGEKFQNLCNHHISKNEHKRFELQVDNHIDVDTFDFTDFDNDELVYCNGSLLNLQKPKLVESKLYEKLEQFKNPFKLVLHNADDEFGQRYLDKLLTIQNLKKIYTRNMDVNHPLVEPIPIGIANTNLQYGDIKTLQNVMDEDRKEAKTEFIYAGFTTEGFTPNSESLKGRKKCYEQIIKQNIPFHLTNLEFGDYLRELKKYKYCISPEGNGIDCYRTWEALYMKTIPICKRSILVEEFAKTFPIYIIDDWKDLSINDLKKQYDTFSWDNWNQLDFETYCRKVGL